MSGALQATTDAHERVADSSTMPRRSGPRTRISILVINAFCCALLLAVSIRIHAALERGRPLPPEPALPVAIRPAPPEPGPPQPREPGRYELVAMRNLFSATRSEAVTPAAPPPPPAPKPLLHGVLFDDGRSRAFLEDPLTKKVFGYTEGDTVAGGRIEKIRPDRVVIVRPEGRLEVSIHDAGRPRNAGGRATVAGPSPPAAGTPAVTPPSILPPSLTPPGGAQRIESPAPPPRPR